VALLVFDERTDRPTKDFFVPYYVAYLQYYHTYLGFTVCSAD